MSMSMSDDICRDFEKGDCRRGKRCRYYHPKLQICRDFQNKKCEREKCRFLHVTRDEEETYENSGILPDHLDEEDARKKRVMNKPYGGGEEGFGMYGKRPRDDGFHLHAGMPEAPPVALLQENEMLKQKVTELQRQIMDLRQMNDTLYEQNTSYRSQLTGAAGGTQTSVPTLNPVGLSGLATNRNYYDIAAGGR